MYELLIYSVLALIRNRQIGNVTGANIPTKGLVYVRAATAFLSSVFMYTLLSLPHSGGEGEE